MARELTPTEEIRKLREELTAAQQKIERQEKRNQRGVMFKVSPKGGVSVFGLGKYPITYYENQWLAILELGDDLRDFMQEHRNELARKTA